MRETQLATPRAVTMRERGLGTLWREIIATCNSTALFAGLGLSAPAFWSNMNTIATSSLQFLLPWQCYISRPILPSWALLLKGFLCLVMLDNNSPQIKSKSLGATGSHYLLGWNLYFAEHFCILQDRKYNRRKTNVPVKEIIAGWELFQYILCVSLQIAFPEPPTLKEIHFPTQVLWVVQVTQRDCHSKDNLEAAFLKLNSTAFSTSTLLFLSLKRLVWLD